MFDGACVEGHEAISSNLPPDSADKHGGQLTALTSTNRLVESPHLAKLEWQPFQTMHHVSLRWTNVDARVREAIEIRLAENLRFVRSPHNPAAGWFFTSGAILMLFSLLTLGAWSRCGCCGWGHEGECWPASRISTPIETGGGTRILPLLGLRPEVVEPGTGTPDHQGGAVRAHNHVWGKSVPSDLLIRRSPHRALPRAVFPPASLTRNLARKVVRAMPKISLAWT